MSEVKHTPEPWAVTDDLRITAQDPEEPQDPWIVADVRMSAGWPGIDDADNARRIVDCVNACEGIADPTAVPELLEALEGLLDLSSESGEIDRKLAFKDAQDAIAKAKGEANDV